MAIHGNPGGFVTAATPTVTTSSAQGIWTKAKQLVYQAAGTWPSPPPVQELYTWGRNDFGALGLGNTTSYNYSGPKKVGSLTNWSSITISMGSKAAAAAIKIDGTLWTWGYGGTGQLGLGNVTYYSSPKQVGSLTNWATSSSGSLFVAAKKADGTIWAWGSNSFGQLGLGNITNYSSPKQVGGLTDWAKISAGQFSCLAIKTDGTLWGWGRNALGTLGLGDTTNRSSPVQVGALTNWGNVALFQQSCAGIKTDGTLWTWGSNVYGVLGLGNTTGYSSPKQVGALTNWATTPKSSSANYRMTVIKTNGTLWAWGFNNYGMLGLGNTTNYSSPKQVGALTAWLNVSVGKYITGATKTDGTLWTWGNNAYNGTGQGVGSAGAYSSPKQVGALTTWVTVSAGGTNMAALKTP